MKKHYLLFTCILFVSLKVSSQIRHDFGNTIDGSKIGNSVNQYNNWYKSIDLINNITYTTYVHLFNTNTIGAKKAIDLVKLICKNNNLDFENPDKDETYLASYVESIVDFENLNLSVKAGGSIVEKQWYKFSLSGNVCLMRLTLDENRYSVSIANPKSQ